MTKVFLCEKPSQAKDIAAVLGGVRRGEGYLETAGGIVTWCFGHLLEQAAPEDYREDWKAWRIEQLPMQPERWQVGPRKEASKQLKAIKTALKGASRVVIATDADREGEMIGREVLEHLGYRGPVDRLWLSALDPESVKRALQRLKPGAETAPLYRAALARSRADWLVGMNLTRAATLALGDGSGVLSVGRVQTPTLALVVKRDEAIEAFRSRDFYELSADVTAVSGRLTLRHAPPASPEDQRIYDRGQAEALAARAQGAKGPLQVATERKRQGPPKLFSLSGLQRACNKRWGWSADKTLNIAQALYETHKATSYPRTDCPFLPNEQEVDVPAILGHLARVPELAAAVPATPQLRKGVFDSKKITAHHAIIPTVQAANLAALDADERRAYLLIARHYLAALHPDHEYDQTTVGLDAGGVPFKATGRVTIAVGWKSVFGDAAAEDGDDEPPAALPPVRDGELGQVDAVRVDTKATQPPERYTEGSLIADMAAVAKYVEDPKLKARLKETSGIGTEATRASIIEVLKKRDYLATKGKQILSTPTGRALIHALPARPADPGETAAWEDRLEAIAKGQGSLDEFVADIGLQVGELVGEIRAGAGAKIGSAGEPAHACPECGKALKKRTGKNGAFWGCTGYPDCTYTAPNVRGKPGKREAAAPASAEHRCPACGKPMRRRTGKNGIFWGCSGYPDCRQTLPDNDGAPKVTVAASAR